MKTYRKQYRQNQKNSSKQQQLQQRTEKDFNPYYYNESHWRPYPITNSIHNRTQHMEMIMNDNSCNQSTRNNYHYFRLSLNIIILIFLLYFMIKLISCLYIDPVHCHLINNVDKHYQIALLLFALLLFVILCYQTMILLSSFWSRLMPNYHQKEKDKHIQLNLQNLALVSNYFSLEIQQKSTNSTSANGVPTINLQLLENVNVIDESNTPIVANYSSQLSSPSSKNASVCSMEICEIEKLNSSYERPSRRSSFCLRFSRSIASSAESVCTERSDYYLELPIMNEQTRRQSTVSTFAP